MFGIHEIKRQNMKGGNINQFMNIDIYIYIYITCVASTWRNGCKHENSKWYYFSRK